MAWARCSACLEGATNQHHKQQLHADPTAGWKGSPPRIDTALVVRWAGEIKKDTAARAGVLGICSNEQNRWLGVRLTEGRVGGEKARNGARPGRSGAQMGQLDRDHPRSPVRTPHPEGQPSRTPLSVWMPSGLSLDAKLAPYVGSQCCRIPDIQSPPLACTDLPRISGQSQAGYGHGTVRFGLIVSH